VLDVGCGDGYFTYYLQQYGSVIGVDYARAMIDMNTGALLAQANAALLPFSDNTFELVFCSNLLHHVPEPAQVLLEMKRVSRQFIVVHEPNRNNPAIFALALANKAERHCLRFTTAYLQELAAQAGLRVIACESRGFVTPNRMPSFVARMLAEIEQSHPLAAFQVLIATCNP
jgi:ubiquinone/menaquinone biosynthesis C-methylase UbiE